MAPYGVHLSHSVQSSFSALECKIQKGDFCLIFWLLHSQHLDPCLVTCWMNKWKSEYSWLFVLVGPAFTIQRTADRNIWETIIPETSQKQSTFAISWQLLIEYLHFIYNYLHSIYIVLGIIKGLPRWLSGKESIYQAGDPGSISGLGRFPARGNGNPLQYSCLENPVDRVAWWATVHIVTKSWTWWKLVSEVLYIIKR